MTTDVLHRINRLIVGLRRALAHDHGDDAWWALREITAPEAQALRAKLRGYADVLHVERAAAHGRLHGGTRRFASLEVQRAWLADHERRRAHAEEFLGEVRLTALS